MGGGGGVNDKRNHLRACVVRRPATVARVKVLVIVPDICECLTGIPQQKLRHWQHYFGLLVRGYRWVDLRR